MRLLREAAVRLRRATSAEGLNLGINLGRSAGAGIDDHVHAHVVPRWAGDSNFMPVIADVHVMPEHLDRTWERLVPFFADVPGEHPSARA
jgi:ATP adenylyltransferase